MSDGGKGSAPRPFSVSHDEWSKRWDAIFGRDLDNDKSENITSNKVKHTKQDDADIKKPTA